MRKFLRMLNDFFYWRRVKDQMMHQIRYTEDMLLDECSYDTISPQRQAEINMHVDYIKKQREREQAWRDALTKYKKNA